MTNFTTLMLDLESDCVSYWGLLVPKKKTAKQTSIFLLNGVPIEGTFTILHMFSINIELKVQKILFLVENVEPSRK